MPFTESDGSTPLRRIALEQIVPAAGEKPQRLFTLTRGFVFREPGSGETVAVPPSSAPSDLASVPSFLWAFIAPYGRQTAAALLHDHLRTEVVAAEPSDRARLAARADRLFRSALLDSDVPIVRAWLMWAAVALVRDRDIAPTASGLRVAHAVVIAGTVGIALGHLVRGRARLLDAVRSIAAVGSAALEGDRARPTLLLALALLPVAPFAIASWVGTLVFRAAETGAWLLLGRRGPKPDGRPTLLDG